MKQISKMFKILQVLLLLRIMAEIPTANVSMPVMLAIAISGIACYKAVDAYAFKMAVLARGKSSPRFDSAKVEEMQ